MITDDTMSEPVAAAAMADEAGRLLLDLRAAMHADGAEPQAVKGAGDARSNAIILERLAERFPGDAVLSEESADDQAVG